MIQLGLVGFPLRHSLSPVIHRSALHSCGLKGSYTLYPVPPGDVQGLKALLARVRNGEITGLNVTIPHKQAVVPLVDELTTTARAIGAINTISMRKGKLTGENTDAGGFKRELGRTIRKNGSGGSALVLGAGGAARAVVYALLNDGWQVAVTARRTEQALALTAQFPGRDSRLSSLNYHPGALRQQLPAFTLLVNTTPVGMSPHVEASPWPAGLPFPQNGAVYDLVYDPGETRLVRDARAAGLPAVSGLGMLVEQAALAFEFWTGFFVERESLFAALEEL